MTRRLFTPRKPLIFLPDCLPWGFLAECGPKGVQGGERKATLLASIDDNFAVSNSPLAGIDAPTPAREKGLQPYGALYCFEWRSEGDWGRAESPQCARRRIPLPCPRWGLTRRLRRELGLAVPRGAHTFLSVAKEKCAKESQRHGATGKRLLLPILTAGLAMSRAMELDSYYTGAERARARLFPPSKWAGLFPSAAYRRPAPAQLAGDILNPCRVGCNGAA